MARIDPDSGETRRAQVVVAVLGVSNYTFACATATDTQPDLLGLIGRALRFIDGVTELIILDNPRALIGQANRYNPCRSGQWPDSLPTMAP